MKDPLNQRKIKAVVCISLIVLLAAVVVLIISSEQPSGNRAQALPDGTTVRLVEVDFNKTNVPLEGGWLHQLRHRWVPPAGLSVAGRQLISPLPLATNLNGFRTLLSAAKADGSLVLALRHSAVTNQFIQNTGWDLRTVPTDIVRRSFRAVAFDELGNEMDVGLMERPLACQVPGTNEFISAWPLKVFPREGSTVGLRLFHRLELGDWRPVAEFTVPNPARSTPAMVTPEALPVPRKRGEFVFVLKNFEVGACPAGIARAHARLNARATFEILKEGRESDAYRPIYCSFADASGNAYRSRIMVTSPDHRGYDLEGFLNVRQPWIIQTEFVRQGDFAPEDLVVITNAWWKRKGTTMSVPQWHTNANGQRIAVTLMPIQNVSATVMMGVYFMSGTNGYWATLVSATGDGRHLKTESFVYNELMTHTRISEVVEVDEIVLTFGIQKGVPMEYVVQPKVVPVTNDMAILPVAGP